MKKKAVHSLWVLGVAGLVFLAGMAWQKELYKRAPRRVTMTIVERPVEIPVKISKAPITRVPVENVVADSVRKALEDSVYRLAQENGRLDSLAREALAERTAAFEDTVAWSDSLGSFYLRELHTVTFDGVSGIATKVTRYVDGKLTTVKVDTEVVLEPSLWEIIKSPYVWLVAAVAFLAGALS